MELPAGRANMQLLGQRRSAEQTAEDDGSNQIFKIADICLGSPSRQEFAGRTNFLSKVLPPPFGASLLPVHHTPEMNEENHVSGSPDCLKSGQKLWSVPECSSKRQAKGGRVEYLICVNFSSLSVEETNKFVSDLRDTCVAIGMDFINLDPAATIHCKCDVPSIIESTLLYVYGLLTKLGMDKPSGLLIVIWPDVRTFDAQVEQACRMLGVVYQSCSVEDVRTSSNQYLSSAACDIKAKVLEKFGEDGVPMEIGDLDTVRGEDGVPEDHDSKEFFVTGKEKGQHGDKMEGDSSSNEHSGWEVEGSGFVGLDEVGEDGDRMGEDSDSSELCGWDEDALCDSFDPDMEGYDDTLHNSDLELDNISLNSSDSEMGEYADSGKQCDSENTDSEQFDEAEEDESYHGQMRKGAAAYITSENFLRYAAQEELVATQMERRPSEKLPLPMAIKRNYMDYGNLQILRGVVVDWACVNFSSVYSRVHCFFDKLAFVCDAMRLHFSCLPMKTFHVKSALPNNIAKIFRGVRKSILELFSRIKMEGEPIGLLLVILPESRDFDAKIEDACKKLGVPYQFCLPCHIHKPTGKYLKQTTREIKRKVVAWDLFIPFVSEGPTIILGADNSCDSVASVVTSVDWMEFEEYSGVVELNDDMVIQQLFNDRGGMIGDLLGPFRRKIKRDSRIIFFRHGINEEHIMHICHQEVAALKKACTHLKIGWEPSVTYVVVGGEIREDSSRAYKHDFMSHHGYIKGTMDARYRVIHDENNLTLLDLDSIIIKLCLLRDRRVYPNVSMVPPAYEAWLQASQAQGKTQEWSCQEKTASPSSSGLC